MDAPVNTANNGEVYNTKAVFEKLCRVNFIDEFWVNIDNPFDNPMKGRCYFTTLRSSANKFTASEFERLLCPMTHSDEEEEVLSTDFWVMQASTNNASRNLKPIDSIRNDPTFKLLYKDGMGVLFGESCGLSKEELKMERRGNMNALINAANSGAVLTTKSIFEKLCKANYVDEFWVNVENPFDNPLVGKCYYTTSKNPANEGITLEFEKLLCPMAYSDDEEEVLTTDFYVTRITPQSRFPEFRTLDLIKGDSSFRLLYKDGRGVLFG